MVGASANEEELAETGEGVAAPAASLGRLVAGATAIKFELHFLTKQAAGGPCLFTWCSLAACLEVNMKSDSFSIQ